MPRNESGQYVKPPGTTAVPNTTIASAPYNALQDDMADALTESLPRTGVAPMLADLPMNGNKITGLADGADAGDAVNFGQLDAKLNKDGSNVGDETAQAAFRAAIGITKWNNRAIGEIIYVDTSLTGVEIPPADAGFIELSAGLDGVGEYNEGKLTSETITGSGATLVATAVIDDAASPMDGETIHLLNTERRMLRPGSAGETQEDAMQRITGMFEATRGRQGDASAGAFSRNGPYFSGGGGTDTSGIQYEFDSGNSPGARVSDDETRVKNIGVTAFLKYKDVA